MNASPPPTAPHPATPGVLGPISSVPPWLPYVVGAAVLALLAWLVVIGVRYLGADTETRRSIRQAARIRPAWPATSAWSPLTAPPPSSSPSPPPATGSPNPESSPPSSAPRPTRTASRSP
ncbi:hypothetical protein ACIQOW_25630 [Kitasatospora sp. NPDC091335]|uniref:hypothetical protein n=1 Tax=Kitasatospora sp. NPDC091335 TaxID=3364085 RepID=UPI00380AE326